MRSNRELLWDGARVAALLAEFGWTATELAARLRCHTTTVEKWIRQGMTPRSVYQYMLTQVEREQRAGLSYDPATGVEAERR